MIPRKQEIPELRKTSVNLKTLALACSENNDGGQIWAQKILITRSISLTLELKHTHERNFYVPNKYSRKFWTNLELLNDKNIMNPSFLTLKKCSYSDA